MTSDKRPNELTALKALEKINGGSLTSETLVESCLAQIREREDTVGAWAFLSPDHALDAARAADTGASPGPLRGLPVAVDMPTTYGSPIYEGHRPVRDASCVALTRAAGGVVLGKTVTTEFAYFQPGKTANPHAPAHTPGGSSSGSAAAVADFMVPLAFGSQTAGSVIRPASFCGVVGYKPSFGLIDPTGVRLLAVTLDTVGVLSRDVRDAAYFVSVLTRRPALRFEDAPEKRRRIGLCHTYEWPAADEDTRTALATAADLMADAGADVREITLSEPFGRLAEAQALIMDFEAARSTAFELLNHHDKLSKKFLERADAGAAYTVDEYDAARALVMACQGNLDEEMKGLGVLVCPSAPGAAPKDLDATGDPVFNRIWTTLGTPCVSVPGLTGQNGAAGRNPDRWARHG